MSQKYITLTLTFDEEVDDYEADDPYIHLELVGIDRETNLTNDQIDTLGATIAQTDRWQVDIWNDIQRVLGNSSVTYANIKR